MWQHTNKLTSTSQIKVVKAFEIKKFFPHFNKLTLLYKGLHILFYSKVEWNNKNRFVLLK